jgi:replication factor C subunit 3/5
MDIPWVEKYRPSDFESIVLSVENRQLFQTMLETSTIPNLLLYGPPGTGKTTTIINLIHAYQEKHDELNHGFMIHLNASDDRGIDLIRNQIYSFAHSKSFFKQGLKFVILDEVDSMTKNAQQALVYLLQSLCSNIRFCLICNYISKIEDSLQSNFMKIKFNSLPKDKITTFLRYISNQEHITISDKTLNHIQSMYDSDLRSMINYLQTNPTDIPVIHHDIWDQLYLDIKSLSYTTVYEHIHEISHQYNMDKKQLMKDFLYYCIVTHLHEFDLTKLPFFEMVIHNSEIEECSMIYYIIIKLN